LLAIKIIVTKVNPSSSLCET